MSPQISGAVLAHVQPDQTVRAYARTDVLDPRREHMQWAGLELAQFRA